MDLRREIEIVDRGQQHPRMGHDIGRALAVTMVGGPEILTIDDLGKADDRVERSLDFMDQLAKRIRVASKSLDSPSGAAPRGASRKATPR